MSESCLLNKPFMLKPGNVSSDDCETWISAFFNSILRSSHFTWAWNYCSDLVCCMMCIFRAAYFFLGPGSHFWAPFGFSCVLPYFSSVCTYCSLFPRTSSALTLPLCLPGSLHLFLMIICWQVIITILAIITIITINAFINIIITRPKPAFG